MRLLGRKSIGRGICEDSIGKCASIVPAQPGLLARLKKVLGRKLAGPVEPWRDEGLTEEEYVETWTVR